MMVSKYYMMPIIEYAAMIWGTENSAVSRQSKIIHVGMLWVFADIYHTELHRG